MSVVAVMSEDEVWRKLLEIAFKDCLHFDAQVRHESILKRLQQRALQAGTGEQQGRAPGFSLSSPNRIENHPMKLTVGIFIRQPQDRAPAPNFNII
jgi:hypothetical protein